MHMINVLPASLPAAVSLGLFASMILRRRNWRRVADLAAPGSGWMGLPASPPSQNLSKGSCGGQPLAVQAGRAGATAADHACISAQTLQGRRPAAVLDSSGVVVLHQPSPALALTPLHPTLRHRAPRFWRGSPGTHRPRDAQAMPRSAVSCLPRRKRRNDDPRGNPVRAEDG